jgi:hypothetical protein
LPQGGANLLVALATVDYSTFSTESAQFLVDEHHLDINDTSEKVQTGLPWKRAYHLAVWFYLDKVNHKKTSESAYVCMGVFSPCCVGVLPVL